MLSPILCLPHQRDWGSSVTNTGFNGYNLDLKTNIEIVKDIKESVTFAAGDDPSSYKSVLGNLESAYDN